MIVLYFSQIVTFVFILFSSCTTVNMRHSTVSIKVSNLEIPSPIPKEEIVHHTAYTLSYNKFYKQANWVAYVLTASETKPSFKRTNKFTKDPLIKNTDLAIDYKKSGYDRGHLAPAGDMEWSATIVKESFYYSNMSPQDPAFNRGVWKKLEEQVRAWAIAYDSVYVVTGPILADGLKTIGRDKVSVPNYFYKVILTYTNGNYNGIGFIMPNKGSKESHQQFAISIDSVETVTHIDFFPALPNNIENKVESKANALSWNWGKESK